MDAMRPTGVDFFEKMEKSEKSPCKMKKMDPVKKYGKRGVLRGKTQGKR